MDCIFCNIAKGIVKSDFIASSERFIAIRDIKPRVPGHTLIIPKEHYVTLLDVPNKLGNELLEFTKKVASKLLEEKYGDGFNVLMNNLEVAGQIVMHAHIHLIPRNEGDKVKPLA